MISQNRKPATHRAYCCTHHLLILTSHVLPWAVIKAARYVVENESDDTITFRFSSMTGRLTKMFEDRITISRTGAGITMEGLRKEVFRMASALEYRLGSNAHPD